MKARPILMHARSIQNLLAGRKTQTRRIVKPQPLAEAKDAGVIASGTASNGIWWWLDSTDLMDASTVGDEFRCPYGVPGDLLWVRETWARYQTVADTRRPSGATFPEVSDGLAGYRADGHDSIEDFRRHVQLIGDHAAVAIKGDRWIPSIHMPRWASRLTLELTDVRVERVQDISEADCIAEGSESEFRDGPPTNTELVVTKAGGRAYFGPHDRFATLWNDTNGPGAWERNDWVWALTFKVHRHNVDNFIQRVTAHETGCRPFRETA